MSATVNRIAPEVKKLVFNSLKEHDFLELESGARHAKLINTKSRDFIILPGSSSDAARVLKNMERAIRQLIIEGRGLIYAKTGRDTIH